MVWGTYLEKNCPSSNGHPWTSHWLVVIYVPLWCNMDGHKHNYKKNVFCPAILKACPSSKLGLTQGIGFVYSWSCCIQCVLEKYILFLSTYSKNGLVLIHFARSRLLFALCEFKSLNNFSLYNVGPSCENIFRRQLLNQHDQKWTRRV